MAGWMGLGWRSNPLEDCQMRPSGDILVMRGENVRDLGWEGGLSGV